MLVNSIQISSNENETKSVRLSRAEEFLKGIYASDARPAQIIFPEIWATGFFSFDKYKSESEAEHGETYEIMSHWAKKLGSYIHTGSFVEKDGEDYYNTSLLLNPNGAVIGKYRKIHLFSFGSKEKEILRSGSGICVVKTEYGNIGLSTCYDLRFPEFFRTMVNLGAEFFLVSSAWPLARVEHWKLFNRVRAIENQSFLISCNGTGTISGSQLGGHSMIVNPWGDILETGDKNEQIVSAEINPDEVRENREKFSALKDRMLV